MPIKLPALVTLAIDVQGSVSEGHGGELFTAALETGAFYGAQYIQSVWIALTQQQKVTDTGEYLRAIQSEGAIRKVRQVGMGTAGKADRYEMVFDIVNTAQHAAIVEYGHDGFHLPSKIQWGATPSVKYTKDGRPYLHIPFRHYVPGSQGASNTAKRNMMPTHIYREAKRLQSRMRENAGRQYHPDAVASGPFKGRRRLRAIDKYSWQGSSPIRLDRSDPRRWVGAEHHGARSSLSKTPREQPAWSTSKYDGMFKTGGPGHSKYMTIRTITPDSAGWNIPSQQGRFLAQQTVERILQHFPVFEEVVLAGMMEVLSGGIPE